MLFFYRFVIATEFYVQRNEENEEEQRERIHDEIWLGQSISDARVEFITLQTL